MSLNVNGTSTIENITYNGNDLSSLTFNGVVVWRKTLILPNNITVEVYQNDIYGTSIGIDVAGDNNLTGFVTIIEGIEYSFTELTGIINGLSPRDYVLYVKAKNNSGYSDIQECNITLVDISHDELLFICFKDAYRSLYKTTNLFDNIKDITEKLNSSPHFRALSIRYQRDNMIYCGSYRTIDKAENFTPIDYKIYMDNINYGSITYGNNMYVAVGGTNSDKYMESSYSLDGINWTKNTNKASTWSGTNNGAYFNRVIYGNGVFVAISYEGLELSGNSSNIVQYIYYSTNGKSWTKVNKLTNGNSYYFFDNNLYFNGELFIISTSHTAISPYIVSSNGKDWYIYDYTNSNYITHMPDDSYIPIKFKGKYFILSRQSADIKLYKSENMLEWEIYTQLNDLHESSNPEKKEIYLFSINNEYVLKLLSNSEEDTCEIYVTFDLKHYIFVKRIEYCNIEQCIKLL